MGVWKSGSMGLMGGERVRALCVSCVWRMEGREEGRRDVSRRLMEMV